MLQMLFQQKMQQIPQGLVKQLESNLKRVNPQALQEFQQARKDNVSPEEYLNKIVEGFNPQQKQQWNSIMSQFNGGNKPK